VRKGRHSKNIRRAASSLPEVLLAILEINRTVLKEKENCSSKYFPRADGLGKPTEYISGH